MINREWKYLFEKYSFIDTVEFKGTYVYFNYMADGKNKYKKLSIRANGQQVQNLIEKIKSEIGENKYGTSKIGIEIV